MRRQQQQRVKITGRQFTQTVQQKVTTCNLLFMTVVRSRHLRAVCLETGMRLSI